MQFLPGLRRLDYGETVALSSFPLSWFASDIPKRCTSLLQVGWGGAGWEAMREQETGLPSVTCSLGGALLGAECRE